MKARLQFLHGSTVVIILVTTMLIVVYAAVRTKCLEYEVQPVFHPSTSIDTPILNADGTVMMYIQTFTSSYTKSEKVCVRYK